MIYNIIDKLKWSYRKNYADLRALIRRVYPYFVYQKAPVFLNEKVPVFTFHSVHPTRFEKQLKFLQENGYHTLNTKEFYEFLTGGRIKNKSVLLTFDDGTASLWGVAFPLLKKYGYRAVSFIIPGCVSSSKKFRPNLEDVWSGDAEMNEVLKYETSSAPLCSWHEIQAMHKSGVIDFQSHTMYHHLVFVSSKLVDFIHPGFNYYFFGNITVPVFQDNGEDIYERNPDWGTPIYESEPRMSINPRYFDNDALRKQCVEFVEINGGKQFFQSKNWRKILRAEHDRLLDSMTENGCYETGKEQEANLFNDLHNSKKRIEEMLPGKKVEHLCYPWYIGSDLAVRLSQKAGYLTNFWGISKERNLVTVGDDAYHLPRLDERYLLRLPGKDRESLKEILSRQLKSNLPGFINNFQMN